MRTLSEIRQRLQIRENQLQEFIYGKPDEKSMREIDARIKELEWVLG